MPITLTDAKNLTQDKLSQHIIDEFRKDPLLENMIFDNCVSPAGGSLSYVYNRVTTPAPAVFRTLNTEYTPAEAATTPYTINLKPFGGSFEVDRVIQNHAMGITDQVTFQVQQKVQATKALFADTWINGDTSVNDKAFDGIDKAITGSSTEKIPAAVIDLSTSSAVDENHNTFLDALDKWLAELDGTPTFLQMNRTMKAVMSGVARRSATFTEEKDEFGVPILRYAGIPLLEVGDKPGTSKPIIPIDAGTGETSIYAARIGLDGVHAITPEGDEIVKIYLPNIMTSGAVKKGEVEMVAAVALKATRAAGVLRRIKIGA